jgi:hypothetical protein
MIVSYGNESIGTIGDFATSWPLISQLSKIEGPIEITLNDRYKKFIGLKEFLEYQDFVKYVDFENRKADLNIECCTDWYSLEKEPFRSYCGANKLRSSINRNLILKVPPTEVPDEIVNKKIIIDRWSTNVLKNTGWFNSDEYYWLHYSNSLSYNINICLKAKKVISAFTGLPVILDLFNKEFDLIWFDDIFPSNIVWFDNKVPNGEDAHKEFFFRERNSKLFYYQDYDFTKQ